MSLKDLLDKLTDYDIYSYYVGQFKIGKLFNSPLRSDDKNPSFAIFKGMNGGLFFKDHGSGEGGNAIKFVKLYKNINTKDEGVGRHSQDMDCIRLDILALAVTQFKPTARKGTRALLIWRAYMRFLNNLLNKFA